LDGKSNNFLAEGWIILLSNNKNNNNSIIIIIIQLLLFEADTTFTRLNTEKDSRRT